MNPLDKLFDEGFAHAILLRRNQELFTKQTLAIITRIERKYAPRLRAAVGNLSGADIRRISAARFSGTAAIDRLNRVTANMLDEIQVALGEHYTVNLRGLAQMESAFWQKQMGEILAELPELADAGVTNETENKASTGRRAAIGAVLGLTIAQSLSRNKATRTASIRQAASQAATRGRFDLFRVFAPTLRDRRRGRIIGGSSAGVLAWARTLHTSASAQGASGFEQSNGKQVDLVAINVLDERTTDECWERHGKLVNRDMGGELPPYHFGCRTYVTPTVLFEGMTRRQKGKLSKETREALQNGLPDADTSTKAFSRLSAAKKKEILGPTRFKLHQDGKLTYPRDFVNPRTLDRWTLEELAAREGVEI